MGYLLLIVTILILQVLTPFWTEFTVSGDTTSRRVKDEPVGTVIQGRGQNKLKTDLRSGKGVKTKRGLVYPYLRLYMEPEPFSLTDHDRTRGPRSRSREDRFHDSVLVTNVRADVATLNRTVDPS